MKKRLKTWEVASVRSSKRKIHKIKGEVARLNNLLQAWENHVDKKSNENDIGCTNFDQEQYDRFCKGVSEVHKNIAKSLGCRSAHDILEIFEEAEEKMWNGEAYL